MLGDMATAARRVCVTGATGKAGRAAVRELREHGYDVVATDAVVGAGEQRGAVLRADLTDYGEATEVLRGADAVVHLANKRRGRARPQPGGVGVERDDAGPAVRRWP